MFFCNLTKFIVFVETLLKNILLLKNYLYLCIIITNLFRVRVKIQNIATVRSGIYIKEIPKGDVGYLQVGDFDKDTNRFLLPPLTLELNNKTESHLLLDGDIVFAAKGISNFSSVFREGMGKMVASSSFLVIQVTDKAVINPDYLCWLLNRIETLSFLRANATGTSMPSISKALVEKYKINVPSIHVQNKIIEIVKLQQREKQLYEDILFMRDKIVQSQLIAVTKQ